MKVLEAKDFLVQQAAEQAALENVPLSDLEKRMMYFTETGECPEDPIALNDAFEAQYDSDEYEAKISKLMRHAHSRFKKENPEAARKWNEAIRELSTGDHYILVLCNEGLHLVPEVSKERPPRDSLKLLGTAVLVAVASVAIISAIRFLRNATGIHLRGSPWNKPPFVQTPMPLWLGRLVWFLILCGYFYFVILPWILKRRLPGLGSVFSKSLRPQNRRNPRD